MTDSLNEPVTKDDLKELKDELKGDVRELRSELKGDLQQLESKLCTHMDNIKDQIIRGFQLTEESIRKDSAHVDEVAALDTRLSYVERQLGMND